MSQQTQAGIQLLIDARIADNNAKDISAGDVREVLTAMNQSFSGPVMIYHGQLKAKMGGSSFAATIKDYYVNLAFFKQQDSGNPTSGTNPVQLNTTGVPGAPNGSTTVTFLGGLVLKLTVANNVITLLEVLKIGGGVQVGSVTSYTFNGIALTFTYNGVITHPGTGTGTASRFVLSTSTGEGSHTEDNTLIQASAVNISQEIEYIKNQMITTNELNSYLKGVISNNAWSQNVTLWRVA
tara:strand:- start:1288 stop:2001 length:714 start_codon:yes stop_codon:yes gene_type:complete